MAMRFFTNEGENTLLTRFAGVFIRNPDAGPSTTHAGGSTGQRADRVKKQPVAFLGRFCLAAGGILRDLMEKYAADGELQFTMPDVLKLPPISQHGNVAEIIGKCGGADKLRNGVNQLESQLYAAWTNEKLTTSK
jgi:hypothetical protein